MLSTKEKTRPKAAFDFNAAVNETYKNYPQLKRKTVFYNAANKKILGKSLLLKVLTRLSLRKIKKRQQDKSSRVLPKFLRKKASLMIFARGAELISTAGNGSFEFDHELGHILNNRPYLPTPLRLSYYDNVASQANHECAADAFATIRHFQRYGIESAEIPQLAVYRAWEATRISIYTHISSPVIAQIWADRHNVDFLSLSPQETWKKAQEYADNYAPKGDDLNAMSLGFSVTPLIRKNINAGNYGQSRVRINTLDVLELMATTCLKTSNTSVFLVGAAVIVPLATSARPLLTDPDWLKVIDKMQERAQHLGVSDRLDMFRQNTADITEWDIPPSPRDAEVLGAKQQRDAVARILKL